jgi:polysaccharide biosynthesis transport protein
MTAPPALPPIEGRYRAVVDALLALRPGGGGLVGVVSPGRGDGRSTVAAGLALALAQEEDAGRVLLLDLDLERPAQAARFGVPLQRGLRDCLADPRRLGQATAMVGPRLWLLPAGTETPGASLDLLEGVVEGGLLDDCRAGFAWTVADLPPLLGPLGAAPVATRSDGSLLVGRYRATRLEALAGAAALLPRPPLAVVMTGHASPVPEWLTRLLGLG